MEEQKTCEEILQSAMPDTTDNLDDVLQHWGIKGQKWGVRRYQNKDGSLTPQGRKRYGSLEEAVGALNAARIKAKRKKQLKKARAAAAEKRKADEEAKAKAEQRRKDVDDGKVSARDMTADELQRRIDKLNLEKRYKQLLNETNPSAETISAGKQFAKKMWNDAVQPAVANATKEIVGNYLKDVAKRQFGIKESDIDILKKEHDKWDYKKKISDAKKTIYDNERKMNGEEDESTRLEKEAKDAKNRWYIEQYNNKTANEKGYKSDDNATASEKMRTKEEAQKQVDAYNESGYGQDTVTPEVNYPKYTKAANPPAVVKSAVTSLSNTAVNSREYADKAYRGEQVFADAVFDRDGNVLTRIQHNMMIGMSEETSDELQHWGIKGQKWGVRRFQNKDGGLTPAGRKRYSDSDSDKTDSNKTTTGKRPFSDILDEDRMFDDIKTIKTESFKKASKDIINTLGYSPEVAKKINEYDSLVRDKTSEMLKKASSKRFSDIVYDDVTKTYKAKNEFGRTEMSQIRDKAKDDSEVKKFRKELDEIKRKDSEVRADKRRNLVDEMTSEALKELGYDDTPETRRYMKDYIEFMFI